MPFATRDGVRLHWKLEGAQARPPLVLLNSIGTDIGMWDRAIPHLLEDFQLLRIDTRGHGASDAPVGDYGLKLLAGDVLAVMDAAGIERAVIAGVSLGGMVAMELALIAPDRVSGLALICTTATLYSQMWDDRIAKVRAEGMDSIADTVMTRFLSPTFIEAHPEYAETIHRTLRTTPAEGYAGAGAAIRDMAVMERLPEITVPTLVVIGSTDISTPLAGNGDKLLALIPGAEVAEVDGPHIAPIEAPKGVAAVLAEHFAAR
jgi:3-oxoadipate enol-lactonase